MIDQHAGLARRWRRSSELPADVRRRPRMLRTSSGTAKGWPGDWPATRSRSRRASPSSPSSSRSPTASAGSTLPARCAATRGQAVRPALARSFATMPTTILGGLDSVAHLGRGDRRRARARASPLSGERFDAALLADRELRRPEVAVHARALPAPSPSWRPRPLSQLGMPDADVTTLRRAGLVHDFGRLGVSNAIWDKRGPLGAGRVGTRPPHALPDRADAARLARAGAARRDRRRSTASGSTARGTRAG